MGMPVGATSAVHKSNYDGAIEMFVFRWIGAEIK